jgi:hypothetical protein
VYVTPTQQLAQTLGANLNFGFNLLNGFIQPYPSIPVGRRRAAALRVPTFDCSEKRHSPALGCCCLCEQENDCDENQAGAAPQTPRPCRLGTLKEDPKPQDPKDPSSYPIPSKHNQCAIEQSHDRTPHQKINLPDLLEMGQPPRAGHLVREDP